MSMSGLWSKLMFYMYVYLVNYFLINLNYTHQIQTSSEEKNSGLMSGSFNERLLSLIVARTMWQALIHLRLANHRLIASVSSLLTGLSSGSDRAPGVPVSSANHLNKDWWVMELKHRLRLTDGWDNPGRWAGLPGREEGDLWWGVWPAWRHHRTALCCSYLVMSF